MRIRLLGTGTPTPSLRRMGSSYLVESGGDVILFDHGSGAYHRLLESGIRPTQVSHLFFSHLHFHLKTSTSHLDRLGSQKWRVAGCEPLRWLDHSAATVATTSSTLLNASRSSSASWSR